VARRCAISLEVNRRDGETSESLLARFQKMINREGILREAKEHRYFVPKGEAAREKARKNARRRRMRSR